MATPGGQNVIKARRLKGRKVLAVQRVHAKRTNWNAD
jgi:hypothetical protein